MIVLVQLAKIMCSPPLSNLKSSIIVKSNVHPFVCRINRNQTHLEYHVQLPELITQSYMGDLHDSFDIVPDTLVSVFELADCTHE